MKLRLFKNSVRLRLAQGEVARVAAGELIEERVEFTGGGLLVYSIQSLTEANELTATFSEGQLRIGLPARVAGEWASSERVGIEASLKTAGGSLQILIEKDFRCLQKSGESPLDAYPNPLEL